MLSANHLSLGSPLRLATLATTGVSFIRGQRRSWVGKFKIQLKSSGTVIDKNGDGDGGAGGALLLFVFAAPHVASTSYRYYGEVILYHFISKILMTWLSAIVANDHMKKKLR